MPSAGSAWIDIQPKLDDFGRRLSQQLSPALERFGRGAVAAGTTLSKYVTAPVVAFGVAAVKAFDEAARADAQTAAVLRSTGGIAHVTAGHVRELAGTIRDYSGVEDEAVQGAENLLLTFVRIRDEAGRGNDVFDQATRVVVDMSQALGQDLRSSAIQVGKALNDPVRGMTALRRVGVQLTDQQERQIKQLVAEGKLRAAQKVILGELTREFGGVAEAMGKTSSAKLQIAMSHLGDSMERVGGIIAPLIERLASFANALARWFDALAPSGQRLVVTILAVAAAVGPALVVVGKLAMGFASVGRAFGALSGLLAANPYVAIIAATIALVVLIVANWGRIRAFLAGAWEAIRGAAAAVWGAIVGAIRGAWEAILQVVRVAVSAAGEALARGWEAARRVVERIWDALRTAASVTWEAIVAVVRVAARVMLAVLTLGMSEVARVVVAHWEEILAFLRRIPGAIEGIFASAGRWLVAAGRAVMDGLREGATAAWGAVAGFLQGLPGRVTGLFAGAGRWLFAAGRAILQGLLDGLRSMWDGITGFVSGIAGWIAAHKGPIEADRALLVPAGRAVMEGLEAGLRSRFASLRAAVAEASGIVAPEVGRVAVPGAAPLALAAAGGGGPAGGDTFHIVVHNPRGEPSSISIARELRRARFLRGR